MAKKIETKEPQINKWEIKSKGYDNKKQVLSAIKKVRNVVADANIKIVGNEYYIVCGPLINKSIADTLCATISKDVEVKVFEIKE